MADDRQHARRRQIARRRRRVRRVLGKAARGIGHVMDEAKQRLSWVPPCLPQRGIVSHPEQLATWLGLCLSLLGNVGVPPPRSHSRQGPCQSHDPMRARRPRSHGRELLGPMPCLFPDLAAKRGRLCPTLHKPGDRIWCGHQPPKMRAQHPGEGSEQVRMSLGAGSVR